jgi:DUF971 family protein
MLTPTKISLTPERELKLVWSDGHIVRYALQFLRDECPCAGCKGEHGLFGAYFPPPDPGAARPGRYDIATIENVGNYAICVHWMDGHDTGIYSWQYLLELENRANG